MKRLKKDVLFMFFYVWMTWRKMKREPADLKLQGLNELKSGKMGKTKLV